MNRVCVRLVVLVLTFSVLPVLSRSLHADDQKANIDKVDSVPRWWDGFRGSLKKGTTEEERLQRFWHDYYDSLRRYYAALDRVDWEAYYKSKGYQLNTGCCGPNCSQRINYAPVFVAPNMQWAIPATAPSSPPVPPK
jgi:hypothetical protein